MLCGMGGSSLCPEVFRQTFGHQDGYPNCWCWIRPIRCVGDIADQIDIGKCLFIISSKSGTTIRAARLL